MIVNELQSFPEAPDSTVQIPPALPDNASLITLIATLTRAGSERADILSSDGKHGCASAWQALNALALMMPYHAETSEIQIKCHPSQYSASAIARAVEDADASILSLLSYPADEGLLNIYIRTNRTDPSPVVRSLNRYGYTVSYAYGPEYSNEALADERLCELQHYLNI